MRIIICDDQALVREGLEMLIGLEEDIDVVATASNGNEAVELVEKHQPELILMDLKMPVMNGIEATRLIKRDHPDVAVLILTTYDDDEWLFDAIRAGASGYLLKDTQRENIIRAIRETREGKTFLDPKIAGKIIDNMAGRRFEPSVFITNKITERELDVLRLVAKGLTNQEIASTLYLSEGTVRNHVSSIFAKLDVSDRTQAAVLAIRHGLG